jgi:outer membrane lipoprotein-sorting protein
MLGGVHDGSGQPSAGGVELGALLALLHRGDAGFDPVEATYRMWRHDERAAAAWQAEIEEEKRRGAAITSYGPSSDSDTPAETETVLRIWRAEDRVREEHEGGPRDGAYAVRDGDLWWSWDPHTGAVSNQDDPEVGFSVGEEVSFMLDPTPLLGSLRFTPVGRGQVAGRDTFTADAVPRLSDARHHPRVFELHQLGGGADCYTLEVDADRGVLLQVTASRDGEPFQRITTDQITFDHPIVPERFRFEPPPGEQVQPARGRHELVHLSLADAQQRAPFTVLIPDRIPPDWHSTCAYIEPSERPPSPATVSLNYHSDDGHQSVSLSQYSASEKPDQYELMIQHGGWQTISRDRTDVQVRAPDGPSRQVQAYIERSETFVFLMSETLTGDELATLATGLKPAPSTSTI